MWCSGVTCNYWCVSLDIAVIVACYRPHIAHLLTYYFNGSMRLVDGGSNS